MRTPIMETELMNKKPTVDLVEGLENNLANLYVIARWLRAMCHVEGCVYLTQCPESCCRLRDDPALDLSTAIAWRAAWFIEAFCRAAHTYTSDSTPSPKDGQCVKYWRSLGTLGSAISLHQKRYPLLDVLFIHASWIMELFIDGKINITD